MQLKDINLYDIGNEIQVVGTIWSGKGKVFATLIPGKDEDLTNLKKMPLTLEEWKILLRQADIVETEMFLRDATGLTKSIFRKSQRVIDTYLQWAVFKRDNYTCRYCGRTGIPLTVDHIDLYELGGITSEENLITCCKSYNKDRGRMPYDEWIKSPIYLRKSKNLSTLDLLKNEAKVKRLEYLKTKRVAHVRSR